MTAPHRSRVVLHVGTPKSGTTYLQNLMWGSRASLLDGGLLYPGDEALDHFRAAVDLRDDGYLDRYDPSVAGGWRRLVEAAHAHPGTTIISQEILGDRSAEDAERAMADLHPAEVHVVLTARDLGRQLPAAWQEDLKNRHSTTYASWLEEVRLGAGRGNPDADRFWLRQDVPAVLARWSRHLPPERVHVVTVPRRGAPKLELWTRFAQVLGVDPAHGTPQGPPNTSLGQAEAEFIRLLNARTDYSIPWPLYASRVTKYLAGEQLSARPGAQPLRLPPAEREWASARADRMITDLARSGCHVVGSLDELRVEPDDAAEDDIAEDDVADGASAPGDQALLDVALDAVIALLHWNPTAPDPSDDPHRTA